MKIASNPATSLAAALAVSAGLALAVAPALANSPDRNADIAGKSLYLQKGSWLRYSDALISRVYTTTKATLEVKGRGACTTRLCPVTHNNVDLWAIRTSLDLSKPDSGPVVTERTLRQGDEGTDVKIAQEALAKAGITLTADGKYGSGTVKAVQQFQDKNDLDNDGEIGPATRIKLKL